MTAGDFRDPTGWPVGDANIPYSDLVDHLIHVASLHARRAVLDRHDTSLLALIDASMSSGAAVELLAKACVAEVDPALLAAPTARDGAPPTGSLLHLRGHSDRVSGSAVREVTTIMARPAIQLAADLHKKVTASAKNLALVLDVRNAAAHLGLVQDDLLSESVVLMAQFVEQTLPALDVDPDEFWTPQVANVVRTLLDKRSDEVARVTHELIAQAGQRYRTTLGKLEFTSRASLIAVLESKPASTAGATPLECPACGNNGWALIDVDVDVEPAGNGEYDSYSYTFIAGFECPVCGLSLDPEMFSAAGLDEVSIVEAHLADEES